jgi:hypothetical protein
MMGRPSFDTPPPTPDRAPAPPEPGAAVAAIGDALDVFAREHKISSLRDRVQRGLDPVGILALPDLKTRVRALCERYGATEEDVLAMTLGIQTKGPWEFAKALKGGEDPSARIWITLNAVNTMGKEREMDMTPAEFLADLERIGALLERAATEPEFPERARQHVLEESRKRFRVEDGVPISEMDNGFVAMATDGYEAGIIQDVEGMLFIGARAIDDAIFERWGLRKELRTDRGREGVAFYVNDQGEALLKKLYPGFVIVLSRNLPLAKAIVQATLAGSAEAVTPPAEALGHTRFAPTNAPEEQEGGMDRMAFLRRPAAALAAEAEPSPSTALVRLKDEFYHGLSQIKAHVIFLDTMDALRQKRAEKGQDVTAADVDQTSSKVERKVEQKMEELRHMLEGLEPYLRKLPPDAATVMDMAGGAGDLGLAVGTHLLADGRRLDGVRIVDPFAKSMALDVFTDMIVDYLPFREELREKTVHTNLTVQEAAIPRDAIVVAKHACGTLSDDIIERWVRSESPLLAIMTCCHDKAREEPARYDLPQDEWQRLCRVSSKTNDPKRERWMQGMAAMTALDEARVRYLQRFGVEARLLQTDKFPKGDVIIAWRKRA